MTYCHVSHQIDIHAHWTGMDQMEEIEHETRMLDSLKMAKNYLESQGRRHCRFGAKPLTTSKPYLNGYSKQYVRENITF